MRVVEKFSDDWLKKYTRNEWEKCETTHETSGEDVKKYTLNEWGRCEKIHSKRVGKM
jgi:hypothetical protein